MSMLRDERNLLENLARRGRLRSLRPKRGADFASNDYLGLAGSDLVRRLTAGALGRGIAPGAGAARLLGGNHESFDALEAEAAAHFGSGGALYFGSGYGANLGLFSALPRARDLVLHDALVHASTRDGIRLGGAAARAFAHNDPEAARDLLRGWRRSGGRGRAWIAVESLYSMDGDFAPLPAFAALAAEEEAVLVVDEAHATGIWGPDGRGLAGAIAGQENVVTLHTCGKALGLQGALVCAAPEVVAVLVNRARSFVYSTAPSPLVAEVLRGVLAHLATCPARRLALLERVAWAGRLARALGIADGASQILAVAVRGDDRCLEAAEALQRAGFDIRAIRAPTVPKGTERLRLSLTLKPEDATIREAFAALEAMLENDRP